MLLYLLFVLSVLLLSSFLIGPLTGRVWMVIVMFIYLLFTATPNLLKKQNVYVYMSLFVIYIILMFGVMCINGDMEAYGWKWILANHFVSIVVFLATYNITRDNTQKRFDIIMMIIMVVLVADSIITILQYSNNPIGWAAHIILTQGRNEETVAFQESHNFLDSLAGMARTPGIFNEVVGNAIFLGSYGVLPFYFLQKKFKIIKILAVIVMGLSLLACFACQERAGMLTLVASVMYLGYKNMRKKSLGLLFALVIFFVLLISIDFSSVDFGRFQEEGLFSNEARKDIWDSFIPFFSENWIWGGVENFRKITGGFLPHNFFLNALVFGGFLGGIVVIVLLFLILLRIYKNVVSKKTTKTTCIISIALLSILAQSFVHNMSLMSGDVFTFLLLGLMASSEDSTDALFIELKEKDQAII